MGGRDLGRRCSAARDRWSTLRRATSPSLVNSIACSRSPRRCSSASVMRNRSRLNHALREKAERAERAPRRGGGRRGAGGAHADRGRAARRRRARAQRHDRAGVGRAADRRADPARAREAFAAVEATGREALTELRRLLGVLRSEDEELALAPQPSLAHVDSLVRRCAGRRAAGRARRSTGEPRALPAGVDLTAYRLVQEALGGARDAGGAGRATVGSPTAPRTSASRSPTTARRSAGGCSACASASRSTAASSQAGARRRAAAGGSPRGCRSAAPTPAVEATA